METNKIYLGDNLETLKTLPDKSVDCCITSPPYYGLRDYGTGTWVGGDPNCNHIADGFNNNRNFINEDGRGGNNPSIGGHVCKLCGAVREDKQVGLEQTPKEYIDRLVAIFTEVKRILKDDGTLWVNIGDTYNSKPAGNKGELEYVRQGALAIRYTKHVVEDCKEKDLIGIPWLLAFALRNDGWYLRQDIIWHKPNPMPESVKDRCTKSHEYIFLLSKSPKYYFDYEAIQEYTNPTYSDRYNYSFVNNRESDKKRPNELQMSGEYHTHNWDNLNYTGKRNKRDVWSVIPSHYKEAHFATFPEELIEPMVLAGCPKGGVVLDPFMGSGTTAVVAKKNNCNYIGCELNPEYVKMAENRIRATKRKLI